MELMRILGIALCGAVMHTVLCTFGRKDMALAVSLCCGLVLLMLMLQPLSQAAEQLLAILQSIKLDDEPVQTMLRITGIALLAQLGAQTCRDADASSLAQKVELAGKSMILCAVLPLLGDLCAEALSLLP